MRKELVLPNELREELIEHLRLQGCCCNEHRDDEGRFKPHENYCPRYFMRALLLLGAENKEQTSEPS